VISTPQQPVKEKNRFNVGLRAAEEREIRRPRSFPWTVPAMVASSLKFSRSGDALLMAALACFGVNTWGAEVERAQFSRKKTAWIGFVKLDGPIGGAISSPDSNPAPRR
jgi:hypothetical protein